MNKDQNKWDARYRNRGAALPAPDPFLVENRDLLKGGRALDVASGLGANSLFLARSGYRVDAIDISHRALWGLKTEAERLGLDVSTLVADLDTYPLARDRYDLAIVFYFFSVRIMTALQDCLKTGGILIYCTYNFRHTSIKPGFNREYLVPSDGLAQYFPALRIVFHEIEAGDDRNLSRLIATKG